MRGASSRGYGLSHGSECGSPGCERVPRIRVPAGLGHGRGGPARGVAEERRLRPDAPRPAAVRAGPPLPAALSFGFAAGSLSSPAARHRAYPVLRPCAAGGPGGGSALSPGPSYIPGGPASSAKDPVRGSAGRALNPRALPGEGARRRIIADRDGQTWGPLPGNGLLRFH